MAEDQNLFSGLEEDDQKSLAKLSNDVADGNPPPFVDTEAGITENQLEDVIDEFNLNDAAKSYLNYLIKVKTSSGTQKVEEIVSDYLILQDVDMLKAYEAFSKLYGDHFSLSDVVTIRFVK